MHAPRVLFVKLSSLGDVVHHLPAITDLLAHRPDAHVAWAVEEAYAELVRLHPGVSEVIPVGLRGLKRNVLDRKRWSRLGEARQALKHGRWDYVIDAQGLIKSALVAREAKGVAFGLDRASARERAAARFYDVKIAVKRERHAVERNRELVAKIFGYAATGPASYGLVAPAQPPAWAPREPYAVLLHAASRTDKRWPDERWIQLGRLLATSGYVAVLPGGTAAERAVAARIAAEVPGAMAAPAMELAEAAALLAHGGLVAGVDTGLTHLAVALSRPTAGIYTATRPELTGLHGADGVNLGGPGRAPTVEAVAAALGYGPSLDEAVPTG
ncbi:MAG TPA: lipopolysaccharide heptosyltransferase I [Usitatibacter sp.]|nr:lipopolysaccharide heptosyltransferase I [Usitatibacter sp.]